jgi:replication-associated recombination protein RarA
MTLTLRLWLARMIEGGEDIETIGMMIFYTASEDIGRNQDA